MYKSRELFNIQTSIDNLSNKFTELENSYYSFLQKSQEENENIISKEVDVNSEFFQSLLKEQGYLQNNVKHLTALEKSFNEELNHLRSLIRHSKEEQTSNAYGDYREIQTLVEYGLNSLHENIFSIEGIKILEQKVGNKIQHYFTNTSELFNQAFSEFPFISKENIDEILSFNKLDDIYSINSKLFEAFDFESDTLKTAVSGSLKNINRFSNDFTKEAQTLQEYLNKARQDASNYLKNAKQKKSHHGETDQVVKTLEQALAESTTWDSKKNETFVNIKAQIEEISKSVRNYLRDFKKQFESIKANNDIMKSVTGVLKSKNPEASTGTFPNPEKEEHKQSAIHSKLQLQTGGASKKSAPFIKTAKDHDDLSSIRGEHSSHEISSSKENKVNKLSNDLEGEKTTRQTREQLDGLLINIGQRFGYLKTSSKSLLMSSGKLLRLVIKRGGEDDFALKVYENDKKAFENYLNATEEAITSSKEKLERLRTKSSKKSISAALPPSEKSKQSDKKRNGHHKKPGDPKIKAMIDDFEKKHGEVFKSVSPHNRRDDSPPLGGSKKDKSQDIMLSSEGFHKTLPTFGSPREPRENSPQLKSLEFELLLLQKRCEELGKERDRLKKEIVDVKKTPHTTDLMPKVQELSEHNDRLAKDNAKLVKLAKKLEQKAIERKSNLKKLFDLMEEKERELNSYKAKNKETPTANLNQVSKQVEEFVNHRQNEMKKQYENLAKILNEKEESLSYLEDFVTKMKPALLNSSKRSHEQSGFRGSSKVEDTVVLDKKKRHINELIAQISGISSAKIKEVVTFLKEERDEIGERLKQTKLSVLDQSDRSNISKDKIGGSIAKTSARDLDEYKEKLKQQFEQIHELEVEKDDLAERCNELVGELEVAQDLRKKVEKNYQEEIGVLNNKIHQLNEYIQEMEVKNNEKFRGSLTGEKWKKAAAPRDEAQQEREENEQRELIEGLQIELQEALGRIDEAAEYLGVVDEGYNETGVVGRLEVVIGGFLAREEEFGKKFEEMEENSTAGKQGQEPRERGDTEAQNEEAIDDLINKNNALEELVETIKIELNERTEDNKELSDMLLVKDNEIEKLTNLVQEKDTESQKIVEEFKALEEFSEKVEGEYQGHIEKLANVLANYGLPIDTAETELTVFAEQLIETLDSTLEAVARMKQDLEEKGAKVPEGDEPTSSRGDLQELVAENEALREALENMNGELEQVKNEKEQIMGDFEGLVAPEEFEAVRERKEELEKEIQELKALLQEKETVLNERDNRVAEISELLIVKDQAIKDFESQRSETKSKFSKNMDEMNAKFWKETQQYNVKVQNLSKQAAKLKEQLQTATVELEEVKQQNEELFQIKLHLEEEIIAKSDEFDNYRAEVENNQQNNGAEKTERLSELERQMEEVKAEIDRRDQLIIQANEEKAAVESELERVYHEVEEFEKQFETVKEEKLALEKELEEAREEIAVLSEKLKETEEETHNIKLELKDADGEIEELCKQKEELEAQLQEISTGYEQLKAQAEETDAQREEELHTQLQEMQARCEQFEVQLQEKHAQNEELEAQCLEQEAQLEAVAMRCEELERHLQESLAQKEDVEGASKELHQRLEESQEEINALKEQVQQLEAIIEKNTEDKKKEVEGIKETNTLLQNDMSFFKATQEELSKQIEAKVKENKQKEERIQKLMASIEEYDQILKESNLDLERKDQALDEIREAMDKLTEANNKLEETVRELEQAAHERGGDAEELENQLQAFHEENEQLKAQIEEQEERVQALEQENELLKNQIKENEVLLDDKDTEIRELEYEREKFLDEVNEYKRAKEEELEAIKSESDIDRASRQDIETASLQMKNEFEALGQTVETLKQELAAKENHIAELTQNVLPQKDAEIADLTEQIALKEKDLQNYSAQTIENEGTLAQNQITIKEQADSIQERDLKIAQYQTALETAESKIQSLENELGEHKDEKEHLTRRVSTMGEEMEIIREHKEETLKGKAQVEKESITMGSRIQELEETVEVANAKIDKLQEELRELREQKEQVENQLEAEINAKQETGSEVESLKLKISNYESKIEGDKAKLQKLQEELRVAKDENDMYSGLLENREADIAELNAKLSEIDTGAERETEISHELEALRAKVTLYESQIESDKARLESVEEELRLSKQENEKYVELLETKEAELLDANTKLTAFEKGAENEVLLSNEIEALRGKTEEYENTIQQINEEIALLQQEVEQLKTDNQGLNDQVQELEGQLQESEKDRENLTLTIETREREFNDLKDTLSGKENELVERRLALEREKDEEIKTLREGVSEYKEKFEESRRQNEEKIKEVEHNVEVKDQELAAQASLMQEKDTEIDALKTWYAEAETKLKEAQEQIEALQKEVETIQQDKNARFEEYEGTIAQAESRVTQLEEELAVATENNQNLQQELDTLEITLENEKATEIKGLQEQIRLKEVEAEKANAALNEVEEEYHEENKRLNEEINHLRSELEHKEEQHNHDMNSLNEEFGELRNIILEKDEELNHKDEELNHKDEEIKGLTTKVAELEKKIEMAEAQKTDRSPMTRFDKFTEGNDFDNFQNQFDQFEDFEESFSADFKKRGGGLAAKAQEKKDDLHEKIIHLEGQITELKASENNLQGEVEELKIKLQEKEGRVTSRGSLEGAHERIEHLEKEVDELNALLMMRNTELANMRTNNVLESQRTKTEHDEQLDQMNENIEELRLRNEEILNELEAVQGEYDVLKREYDALALQNDKLHVEFRDYKEKDALTMSRGRTSEAMRSPEFSPEKPMGGESLDISDPEQLKLRLADYERKVEKLKVDRRGMKETNHNLKEENAELRKTMKMFQEQIVMLNQTSRQEAPSSQGNDNIAIVLKESFSAMQSLKSFRGRFDFKGDNAQEVKMAMNFIREALHNQDLEIEHLNQVAQENQGTISSQDKLHEEAQKEINLLEEAMVHKLSLLLTETESILRDIGLDTPPVNQDLRSRHDLIQEEKLIYSCLRALRMVAQEAKSQKTAAPPLIRGVSNTSGPESKNLSLQIRPIPMNDTSPSRTGESSGRRRREKSDHAFSAPDEADDAKARSFIEEESYDIEKELQARPDIGSPQTEKEYIQRLLSEIRNLQDENDQLDSEYKQLKNDFEIMKFLNEDLKADIVDKDERIKKLLETMMTEKGENKSDKADEEKVRHEKESIKKIFLKFIDSALQGSKDAEELFKVLLTMLEIPEQDKAMLLTGFKSKSSKKGGMFSKMFK